MGGIPQRTQKVPEIIDKISKDFAPPLQSMRDSV